MIISYITCKMKNQIFNYIILICNHMVINVCFCQVDYISSSETSSRDSVILPESVKRLSIP